MTALDKIEKIKDILGLHSIQLSQESVAEILALLSAVRTDYKFVKKHQEECAIRQDVYAEVLNKLADRLTQRYSD